NGDHAGAIVAGWGRRPDDREVPPLRSSTMPNATTIAATIRADGSATLEVDGRVEGITTTRHEDARREIVHRAALVAASLGTSVPVTVVEPDAAVHLLVGADGSMTVIDDVPAPLDT